MSWEDILLGLLAMVAGILGLVGWFFITTTLKRLSRLELAVKAIAQETDVEVEIGE